MDSKLLVKEMDSIIKEVFADSKPEEQILATIVIAAVSDFTKGLCVEHKRQVFEILYKYYALLEGMKK